VFLPNKENQTESFALTVITYLPSESVKAWLLLLNTITDSIGLLPEISYTTPLTVKFCACVLKNKTTKKKEIKKRFTIMLGAILRKLILILSRT
jgi:hypothetical protein